MDPYSQYPGTSRFGIPTAPLPFQSGYQYCMYNPDTVSQQFSQAQPYNYVLHGPAQVNASTCAAVNMDTPNNTGPVKKEYPFVASDVSQSPNSKIIAQALLDLGSNRHPKHDN